ncbi:3'(2'),5'-bisphosphate nucleotidase [Ophiocordyceps camponoti-floridani]|uniref:3'(2'),5'-bisphosphate nucleotidase n=1 Tax=Ophiocordyceps camponoti-floridani TaxID=2030778 RepID=A0A8H4QEE2_9HYPO|nr:3'(2'),5'-bisphosphate nucleotidase [Ophiocordyceps camponoti-floridani]
MPSFTHELQVAQSAVRRAATLTASVFTEASKGTISKSDASPVTVGDFGAQAVIAAALRREFPQDEVVAEEEAALLRGEDGAAAKLRAVVWRLVGDVDDGVGGEDAMLDLLDRGHAKGGSKGRFWTIDPIDGTKGFLRGGQYAVCLALIIDSDVKVGVLACPNLPVSDEARLTDLNTDTTSHRGVLFSAIAGQGATSQPLDESSPPRPITMRPIRDLSLATFCESVEAAHSAHGDQAAIANRLGITQPSVRLDSQAKYGSIARGAGDIYLRLPVKADYQEKIWDHAAGDLIVREAGGCVTDIYGKRLDFGAGRTLANNKGVVAAPVAIHPEVLKAVQQVLNVEN